MKAGDRGEQLAGQYMEGLGFKVVRYNYRTRYGEIDLVLESDEFLVFLEVKTRKSGSFAAALEHVSASKQSKIRLAAQRYLQENQTKLQPRFDVMEIYAPLGADAPVRINHIENAF